MTYTTIGGIVLAGMTLAAVALAAQPADGGKPAAGTEAPKAQEKAAEATPVLSYTMKDIDGKDQDLSQYKGKVVLIVNVASKCGYTPQYGGLEAIYNKYKDRGFVVLGFPSNDFGDQEPGKEADIKAFCTSKYKVTFPMFGKIAVKGADAHPLFKNLAGQKGDAGGEPKWNFNKYLIDKTGNVVRHFESGTKPEADELTKKVEELLAAK